MVTAFCSRIRFLFRLVRFVARHERIGLEMVGDHRYTKSAQKDDPGRVHETLWFHTRTRIALTVISDITGPKTVQWGSKIAISRERLLPNRTWGSGWREGF
jgi:hypothetical protein